MSRQGVLQHGARGSGKDLVYNELLEATVDILKRGMGLPEPSISAESLKRGLEVSKMACSQADNVPMTPIMENILKHFDGIDKIHVNDPPTKAEKYINEKVASRLVATCGPKLEEYDDSLPIMSPDHYKVDCWHNFKEVMRDIQPGQETERRGNAKVFTKQVPTDDLLALLRSDNDLKQAVLYVLDMMPTVTANPDYHEVSAPFMTKHTNVGYLKTVTGFSNDKNHVEKVSDETFGQRALSEAEQIKSNSELYSYNISTLFGRNQRGKGRLLIAVSRVVNIYLNRLESREIETLKTSTAAFAGYRDDTGLKDALKAFSMSCDQVGYVCENFDQSKYDIHINPVWLALIGAMREYKTRGALGKKLARERAILNIKTYALNGMTGELETFYGRMFSGFIDTNQGDGWIEIIVFLASMMKQDPKYLNNISRMMYSILVMGDDCLIAYDPQLFDMGKLLKQMLIYGFEINEKKGEYGVFFLQNRLYFDKGNYVMVYPWTRVLKSMLFKEREVGLGKYGWLMSFYQQLNKLKECDWALDSVVRLVLPWDELQLGVNMSVSDILSGIRVEDQLAMKNNGHRYLSTAQKLYDGDPTKQSQFSNDGSTFSSEYVAEIHAAVVASWNRCRADASKAHKKG